MIIISGFDYVVISFRLHLIRCNYHKNVPDSLRVNMLTCRESGTHKYLLIFYFKTNCATHSTCAVCGNISTGCKYSTV
jgi:hypothetical protein